MRDAVVAAVVCDDAPCRRAAAALFGDVPGHGFSRDELRPGEPFAGPLFAACAGLPAGGCVGLVVPVVWRERGAVRGRGPAARPRPELIAIADHLNLELCGPLSGRWPLSGPRTFPPLAGIYQPAVVRARGGPRVYSSGVVVAGVGEAGRLAPFETRAIAEQEIVAVSDVLVPPAIVAAHYGLTLAACGVVQAGDYDEE